MSNPRTGGPAKPRGSRKRRRRKPPGRGTTVPPPSTIVRKSTAEPLSEREHDEARTLLDFLKQHKSVLRLSVNAAEDLLINGRREPIERGVLLHLFRKVDAQTVDRALGREPLASDPRARARFMAGIVRIDPGPQNLLAYLEAIVVAEDQRQAARALSGVTLRLDFDAVSRAQWMRLVELVTKNFSGSDRVQALIGLLDNPSFARAVDTHRDALVSDWTAELLALRAAHAYIVTGAPLPSDEAARTEVLRGVKMWLACPESVLRSFPEPVRWRLAERAVEGLEGLDATEVPKGLVESLPHRDRNYARLAMSWTRRLLGEGADAQARSLLGQVVEAHPQFRDPARLLAALDAVRIGPLAFDDLPPPGAWAPACWLPGALFGMGRWVEADAAKGALAEAELQADLLEAGLCPVIAWGPAGEGRVFAFAAIRGTRLTADRRRGQKDAVSVARLVAQIARTLASRGIELPDLSLARFVVPKQGGVVLIDVSGARRSDPSRAAMALAEPARLAVVELLQGGAARRLEERLARRLPLALLVRSLFEA